MGTRTPILLRPHWTINNQLTLPLVAVDNNGRTAIRGLMQLIIPITIFIDTIFSDKAGYTARSFGNEKYQVYKSVEGILQSTGIDGKACLLRTICEMQTNPIGEFTVVGEIITILLSPKRGINDFLHEYIDAEQIGQSSNMTCAREFSDCPISLYNLFRSSRGDSNEMELDEDEENESSDTVDGEEASELHLENNSNRLVDHSEEVTNHFLVEKDVHHSIRNGIEH
ncbi:uncharacterized protein LOC116927754 [Daphnia magna]|uniref:uncharacterized protein LOC116927754 n=1 Tax=Daphnia magna TaxID=35525 RepID=UPI0014025B07|nr:uncharacterized protein LOC116927754 [Daphnia magna]